MGKLLLFGYGVFVLLLMVIGITVGTNNEINKITAELKKIEGKCVSLPSLVFPARVAHIEWYETHSGLARLILQTLGEPGASKLRIDVISAVDMESRSITADPLFNPSKYDNRVVPDVKFMNLGYF